jgi:hypothetical protein
MDISTYVDQIGAGSGYFKLPETAQVVSKRAVVATCVMASKIYAQGLFSGWFTHIFMDEVSVGGTCRTVEQVLGSRSYNTARQLHVSSSTTGPATPSDPSHDFCAGLGQNELTSQAGHAEEPLALAGIAGLAGPNTRVVLVGDPRQLGPIIHSRLARDAGLGTSWMERLLGRAPYAPDAQVSAQLGQ